MKRWYYGHILALCLLAAASAQAQKGGFGVGGMLGEPLGASFKAWLSDSTAIDGGVGWASYDDEGWQLHSDYLWHQFDWLSAGSGRLPVYYGIGARLKFADDTHFGIRGPIGVSYILDNAPVDIFAEVAPILDFTPNWRVEWNAFVGARYWF
jgi:hypothetical protein